MKLKKRKKLKHLIGFIFLILFTFRCSDKNENILELNSTLNRKLKLSTISHIVQLEKTEQSLLKYIYKAQIDKLNNRIFVLSNRNIYMFDYNGKFVNKLKVGRGPGEIKRIISFTINTKSKIIYVIDDSRKICLFDYSGKIIKSYELKEFGSNDIIILDDDNVLLLSNYVGGREKYFVGRYNLSSEKIVEKLIPAEKSAYPKMKIDTYENFSKNNGEIFFQSSNVFGLFKFNNSDFVQILSFNIGKKAVPKSFSDKFIKKQPYSLRNNAKKHHYAPYLLYGFLFKGYYFIGIDDDNLNCYAINSTTKEVYHNGSLPSYFNLPDKESFKYLRGTQENKIILQGVPYEFFDNKTQDTTREIQIKNHKLKINIDDNPFLVIIE